MVARFFMYRTFHFPVTIIDVHRGAREELFREQDNNLRLGDFPMRMLARMDIPIIDQDRPEPDQPPQGRHLRRPNSFTPYGWASIFNKKVHSANVCRIASTSLVRKPPYDLNRIAQPAHLPWWRSCWAPFKVQWTGQLTFGKGSPGL